MTRSLGPLLTLLVLTSCSHGSRVGDKRLKALDAPTFLREAGKRMKNPEYFVKTLATGAAVYEVKEADGGGELSISFTQAGAFLEEEEDIRLQDLDPSLKINILSYLDQNYPSHKILEIERRTVPGKKLIDVEIRHDSSPSGYWELTFDLEGNFVARELEDYDPPLTHN